MEKIIYVLIDPSDGEAICAYEDKDLAIKEGKE